MAAKNNSFETGANEVRVVSRELFYTYRFKAVGISHYFVHCRLIHVKLRELQGKDTNDIPEMQHLEHQPEEIPDVQSDTRVAEPDTVSLKEGVVEDVPPPLNAETRVSPVPPSSEIEAPPSSEIKPPPSAENGTPPSAVTGGDDAPSPSTTQNEVATEEGVPPPPNTEDATNNEDANKASGTTEESNGIDSKGLWISPAPQEM
jgi:hypothetical protein